MASAAPEKQTTIAQLRSALARRFPEAGVARLDPGSAGVGTPPPAVVRTDSTPPADAARSSQVPSPSPVADSAPVETAIPAGAITEVIGPPGAGGCSLVLGHMAELLKAGNERYAAYVDVTRTFYPPAAAALGVPLERLILLQPHDLAISLRALEVLLRGGAARMVVLDLPSDAKPLRLATYHRLRRRARQTGVSLVLLTPVSLAPADHRIDLTAESSLRVAAGAA